MDPILKVNLLQQVLDTGIRGSHCLEKAFGRHLEWIKEAKINAFANWLDPADSGVANERKEGRKEARELSGRRCADQGGGARHEDQAPTRRVPLGWMAASEQRRTLGVCDEFRAARSRFAVCGLPAINGRKTRAQRDWPIRSQGGCRLTRQQAPSLVEGRPVYLKVP